MVNNASAPSLSLTGMLLDLQYEWHSSEYYIASDDVISKPRFTTPFRPEFYGIILCVQGWMDLLVNGHRVHMTENGFFAGGPDMVLQRAGQSENCKNKAVFFTKEFLVNHFSNFNQFVSFHFFSTNFKESIYLSKSEARPLIKLYGVLQEKRNKADSALHIEIIRNLIAAYVYETAIVYRKKGLEFPEQFTKEADISNKFQSLVAEHGIKEHRLQFYADALFITPKYLIGAIRKVTGKTPGTIIDEAILREACALLTKWEPSIEVIADKLHFADQASFSKFFKKHMGVSPLAYRKKKANT